MKNKNLFVKIVFIALIVLILFSLVAPAIFSQTLPPPKQEKLLNGLKVLMWSDAKANEVSVKIRVHAGSAFDPQGKEGVMQLLADNIFPNEAAREFFVEDLGGSLEVITTYDYIQINAASKPDQFLSMLETLASAVANMPIDKETTARLRSSLAAKLAVLEADPSYVADHAAAKRLFGTFPYGRPRHGTPESLQRIDFADLIDARQRFLTADNATIAVSGNFDRALGFRAMRRYFGSWLKADKRVPATFRQPDDASSALAVVQSTQPYAGMFRFTVRGAARADKDLGPALVYAAIIENRLKSRVPESIGRALTVTNNYYVLPGRVTVGFNSIVGDNNLRWSIGKAEANELIVKLMTDPVIDSEFQTAKAASQVSWAKKDPVSFWLDADTYKITNPDTDSRIVDNTTLADVIGYSEKMRKSVIAGVVFDKAPQAN